MSRRMTEHNVNERYYNKDVFGIQMYMYTCISITLHKYNITICI